MLEMIQKGVFILASASVGPHSLENHNRPPPNHVRIFAVAGITSTIDGLGGNVANIS
jgi:hypothetical protein